MTLPNQQHFSLRKVKSFNNRFKSHIKVYSCLKFTEVVLQKDHTRTTTFLDIIYKKSSLFTVISTKS